MTTLKDLYENGYRGMKVSGIFPGTDPNATEDEVVAEIKHAIDYLIEQAEKGTLEFVDHFDD